MPELPEVETVVRGLRAGGLVGRRIRGVAIHWPRIVARPAPRRLAAGLRGRRVEGVARRGKFIVVGLSGGWTLLIHLRMTGRLLFRLAGTPRDPHEHVVLDLDDGRELRFRDTRKFGRWTLARGVPEELGRLGPEPLTRAFSGAFLEARLGRHRRMLKPLLLDQSFVAGLGNIYVDEALWHARLHPRRCSASLTSPEAGRLHRAIRVVLRRGIRSLGTTLGKGASNFHGVGGGRGRNQEALRVFRRTGQPCPACGAPIRRIVVAQRSTHICPTCQPARAVPPMPGRRS